MPQIAQLTNIQNSCASFAALSEQTLMELEVQRAIRTYLLEVGEALQVKGGSGKDAFNILYGALDCTVNQIPREVSHHGCNPLVLNDGDSARFEAKERTLLCRADRDQVDYMLAWSALLENIADHVRGDIRRKLERLRNPLVFMRLPFDNVVQAFEKMQTEHMSAGMDVVVQGQLGDKFYIIEEGTAEIWQSGPYDEEQKKIAELRAGDQFGEEALVTSGSRNATVRMMTPGRLLSLSKADFEVLIKPHLIEEVGPTVAKAMMDDGWIMVDVRYEEEWEDGHIENAILVPLHELRKHLPTLDKTRKYIAYCLSGKRSAVAAMIMAQAGLSVVCMGNGLRDWTYGTVSA